MELDQEWRDGISCADKLQTTLAARLPTLWPDADVRPWTMQAPPPPPLLGAQHHNMHCHSSAAAGRRILYPMRAHSAPGVPASAGAQISQRGIATLFSNGGAARVPPCWPPPACLLGCRCLNDLQQKRPAAALLLLACCCGSGRVTV